MAKDENGVECVKFKLGRRGRPGLEDKCVVCGGAYKDHVNTGRKVGHGFLAGKKPQVPVNSPLGKLEGALREVPAGARNDVAKLVATIVETVARELNAQVVEPTEVIHEPAVQQTDEPEVVFYDDVDFDDEGVKEVSLDEVLEDDENGEAEEGLQKLSRLRFAVGEEDDWT